MQGAGGDQHRIVGARATKRPPWNAYPRPPLNSPEDPRPPCRSISGFRDPQPAPNLHTRLHASLCQQKGKQKVKQTVIVARGKMATIAPQQRMVAFSQNSTVLSSVSQRIDREHQNGQRLFATHWKTSVHQQINFNFMTCLELAVHSLP